MAKELSYVNLSYLESIADGDKDIIKELIEIFLDQMPEFNEGFEEFLKDRDWLKIAAVAHKAKSSVVSMGMEDLGNDDLKNLELLAKQMRIVELEKENLISNSNIEEIENLKRNFEGYPQDRVEWVVANANVDMVVKLIDKFNFVCAKAVEELKYVISTY